MLKLALYSQNNQGQSNLLTLCILRKAVIVLHITLLLFVFSPYSHSEAPLRKGDIAPNWMLQTATGQWFWLYKATPKYDATVLFFWASWCEQCKELLPFIEKLQNNNSNINVLALNVWETQDPTQYFEQLNISLTMLPKAESVATRYKIAGTPGFIVISQERKILHIEQGTTKNSKLIEVLSPFLHSIPQAATSTANPHLTPNN